jgi:1-aminocyclopropane-1-carboxylate deaminase
LFLYQPIIQEIDLWKVAAIRTKTTLSVLRLDLIDGVTGGNKYFKLKHNLIRAGKEGNRTVLTFGGPYSNHIAATARLGVQNGLRTIGIIRGEPVSNVTLNRAQADGMELHFADRSTYRLQKQGEFAAELSLRFNNPYIIPEGGSNAEGIRGCTEILENVNRNFDRYAVCCGTGATLAGLSNAIPDTARIDGFSVLKDNGSIANKVTGWLGTENRNNWVIHNKYACGGYARSTPELSLFIAQFKLNSSISIEPVYTAKMFFGLFDLIRKNKIKEPTKILAIHTGGLQYLSTDPAEELNKSNSG